MQLETVATAYSGDRPNSLNFLRWVLASAVIFYHGYIIAAMAVNPVARVFKIRVGPEAVAGFFLLGGFLVARSCSTSSGPFNYLWRRAIRVMPAFWLSLVVTAFVLVPLSWHHSRGSFTNLVGDAEPWMFVWDNKWLTVERPAIAGAFVDTRFTQVQGWIPTNGSLWTLRYEFICYVLVGAMGALGLLWRRRAATLVATVLLGIGLLAQAVVVRLQPNNPDAPHMLGAVLKPFEDPELGPLMFAFLVGTCAALYASHIALDGRLAATSVLAVFLIARWEGPVIVLGAVPMLYAMLWFGSRVVVPGWNRIGDPSYGVYLYGWPVQALFAEYGLHRAVGIHLYIVLSIAVATVLGWLSWHLVERHVLKLKRWNPMRSRRQLAREALVSH